MSTVRKLQDVFGGEFQIFLAYVGKDPGYEVRLGYDTPQDMWDANPDVEFVR